VNAFLADPAFALSHAKAFFLSLSMLLIVLVGPANIVNSLHRSLRLPAYVFIALSFVWLVVDTFAVYRDLTSWTPSVTFVSMGVFFGVVFYAAKKHRPVVYGAIEIVAGAVGLGVIGFIQQRESVLILIFGAASSVYIVVRGLTNINDALIGRDNLPVEPVVVAEESDELEPWEFPPEPAGASPEAQAPTSDVRELEPWEFGPDTDEASIIPKEATPVGRPKRSSGRSRPRKADPGL
jgi:hypothetical protein